MSIQCTRTCRANPIIHRHVGIFASKNCKKKKEEKEEKSISSCKVIKHEAIPAVPGFLEHEDNLVVKAHPVLSLVVPP